MSNKTFFHLILEVKPQDKADNVYLLNHVFYFYYSSPDLIERSRSEARIKLSNILMILTALASVGAIFAGKAAVKRGESVHQMNLDWHKKYEEDFKKKEESASKA